MQKIVYLDNGATTKVDERVARKMEDVFLRNYGNASSMHLMGREARNSLDDARKIIKKRLNAKQVIFTSGGSESDNLAIKGVAYVNGKGHIITSKIEHPAVLRTCEALEKEGFEVSYLDVDDKGMLNSKDVEGAIRKETILVSVMAANNEIGTIQDIEEIGKICRKKNVVFHTDAVQAFTKLEIDMKKMNIDLLSLSGHKLHGPKGIGVLAFGSDVKIKRLIDGGGQEFKLRAGTENVPGAVGFAEAAKLVKEEDVKMMEKLRDKIINTVLKEIPDTKLNGHRTKRLVNNAHFSFKGVEGESLGGYLYGKGICTSTGSACASLSAEPSHVLTAIGLDKELASGSMRITLSKFTTEEEVDYFLMELPKIVKKLRKFSF